MRGRGEDGRLEIGWKREGEKSDLIESLPRTTQSRKLKPTIQVNCEPKSSRIQKPYIGGSILGVAQSNIPIDHQYFTITNVITNTLTH